MTWTRFTGFTAGMPTVEVDTVADAWSELMALISGRECLSVQPPISTVDWYAASAEVAVELDADDVVIAVTSGATIYQIVAPAPEDTAASYRASQVVPGWRETSLASAAVGTSENVLDAYLSWLRGVHYNTREALIELLWPSARWVYSPIEFLWNAGAPASRWLYLRGFLAVGCYDDWLWQPEPGAGPVCGGVGDVAEFVADITLSLCFWGNPDPAYGYGASAVNRDAQDPARDMLSWPGTGSIGMPIPAIQAVNEAAKKINASATKAGSLKGARGRRLIALAGSAATLPAIDNTADNACRRLAVAVNAAFSGGSAVNLTRPTATVAYNRGVMIRGK